MSFLQFNAANVAPTASYDALPAGVYVAQITSSEVKTSKSGGQYLKLEWMILDSQFKGRKVFENINFKNASEKAQAIGQASLSSLCRALGQMQITDSSQLHNKPCKIKLVVEKSEQYGVQNNVKAYEPVSANVQPGYATPQGSPTQSAAPWGGNGAAQAPAAPEPWQ